jgi:DNA-binding MarR family transcriptional regulator
MPKRGDKAELRLWLRLLACSGLIERRVRGALREDFATTLPRFDVLAQLDRAPEGLRMGDLSRRLMVSNGNVTGLIDRLVQEELVSRETAPGDRRKQVVRLTPAGRRAFDAMAPAHEAWIVDMMSGLERDDMGELLELLGRLRSVLDHPQTDEGKA